MLQNAYFLAKIGVDTAETSNILPKFCQPTLSDVSASDPAAGAPGRAPAAPAGASPTTSPGERQFGFAAVEGVPMYSLISY